MQLRLLSLKYSSFATPMGPRAIRCEETVTSAADVPSCRWGRIVHLATRTLTLRMARTAREMHGTALASAGGECRGEGAMCQPLIRRELLR